jgi:hypothetical protein
VIEQVWLYAGLAVVSLVLTILLLLITKVALAVTLGCALLTGAIVVLVGRIEIGFWDPLAPVAFIANAAFGFIVSVCCIVIGRSLRWPLFVRKR